MTYELKNGQKIEVVELKEYLSGEYLLFCKDLFSGSNFLVTQADEFLTTVEEKKREIQHNKNSRSVKSFVALTDNGKVIGNIDFHVRSTRRRIAHRGSFGMGVHPDWRGIGLGSILLAHIIEWAKSSDWGIEKVELSVMEDNHLAIEIYKKYGFQEEGRIYREIKLEDGTYLDGILMGLWLHKEPS